MNYLGPDAKSQVTFEYEGRKAVRVDTIVISTQHAAGVSQKQIKQDVIEHVIKPVIPEELMPKRVKIHVNPT